MKRFITLLMLTCLMLGAASTATADARPSYQNGFARSAAESARPQDWDGLVLGLFPALGPSGLLIQDWSGHGNHGTLNGMDGADWIVDGEFGYVLDFDKSDDYIAGFGTLPQIDGVVPITVMAWVNGRSFTETTANINTIIGKEGGSGNFTLRAGDTGIGNGQLQWVVRGVAVSETKLNGATLSLDTWYFVAATYERSGRQAIYVNGLLDVQQTVANGTIRSGDTFEIGRSVADVGRLWDGQIAQVRIYDGIISPSQIAEIHQDSDGIVRLADDHNLHSIQAVAASPTSQIIIISWIGGFGALTMLGFIRRKKPNAR